MWDSNIDLRVRSRGSYLHLVAPCGTSQNDGAGLDTIDLAGQIREIMARGEARGGQLVHRTTLRPERGVAIQLQTKRVALKDGGTGEVSTINLAEAEVPDRNYVADSCAVEYSGEMVRLAFAQPKLGSDALRSLVLVWMTPGAAAQFVKSLEEMQSPSLLDIAERTGVKAEELLGFPRFEPEQTASLMANIAAIAIHGRETTIDFYHANAFSQLHAKHTKSIYLEPIVRVNLKTSVTLSLVKRLQELRAEFPADAAIPEEAK